MIPTPMLKRLLFLFLISFTFTGLLSACGDSDSDDTAKDAQIKAFDAKLIELTGVANKTTSADFTIESIGKADLTYSLTHDADWLEIAPEDGTLAPKKSQAITFTGTCPDVGSPTQTVVDLKTNDPGNTNTNIFVSLKCTPDNGEEEEEEDPPPAGKANLNFKVAGVPAAIHSSLDDFIHVYHPEDTLLGAIGEGKLVIDNEGVYTIKADDITDSANDALYNAPAQFTVTVSEADFKANSIPDVTVTYTKYEEPVIMADINVAVEGLPDDVDAQVEILNDQIEVIDTITAPGKYTVQAAGTYIVLPLDVTHNGILYKASDEVEVIVTQEDLEEDTIAPVTVSYTNPAQVTNTDDDGPGSLRAILEDVPEDSTITFASDVETITLTSGPIEITQNITIDGARKVTIDGDQEVQLFTINTDIEVTLRGLTLLNAFADTNGGAINNENGTLNIDSCLFDFNSTEENGGAIASKNGTLNIINSTFVSGSAVLGAAIYSDDNDTKILFSTISDNMASSGGGIAAANTKPVQIGKSIVAQNISVDDDHVAPDLYTTPGAEPFVSLGYNLIGDATGALGFIDTDDELIVDTDQVGTDTDPIDPNLGGLATNDSTIGTMSVGFDSPAYARIPADDCTDTDHDQRGKPRPTHGFCDIGAFELGTDTLGGLESFDNSEATASYLTGSFVGNHDITWNYVFARNTTTSTEIDGAGLIIQHDFDTSTFGTVIAENIPGGIQDFSVKLRRGGSGGTARQVELFINDVSYGKSQSFGSSSDTAIHTFTVTDINISGPFKLEVRHATEGPKSNGRHIAIDNIAWTPFP